ncbi:hypothetical protein COW99_05375 [Candidatus Roizmanbacteria bacterium CG22_combo_CG10-13_8_21_14_all_38_20]|uniref:5'-3' exonuclease domain-containing protein n=1 Tax=Candidatus Roizmanbacteria bacterium CG22_combo_CG10-13_8_21_14_all_38_20 TaxID=1974862 RepID=A0A2H0BUA7_9BACT|nr:hypothetical protein [Candidatus Microgenomates bacterium]PIP61194.1 MAG: hypothetical protein COW99_05375 [Candidatus Roizmanbacteria bacterium CG22_combo_CG10-13_8_21_14_all_38_20]PJC31184.1 MAG: hypothetical protein CO050_04035 [Candidatus Roizmanbacteria bacterium CG_4_9_14_0_2_um_filter_38_17]
MEKLLLIDSNAILYRAFYALPETLTLKDKTSINAIYGFTQMLLSFIELFNPAYIICAFDLPLPTFRDKLYENYRVQRKLTPDNLISQIKPTKELLHTLRIPIYEQAGYEADDIIGTLANLAQSRNLETVIITGDRDLLQLVSQKTKVYMPVKGIAQGKLFGETEVEEKYKIHPQQMVDYKALMGDPSDNYPGVKGIGPKSASELITKYSSLEEVYNHLQELSGRQQKLLSDSKKDVLMAKKLAQIVIDIDIDLDLNTAKLSRLDTVETKEHFDKLAFRSHWARVKKLYQPTKPEPEIVEKEDNQQLEML